MTSRLDEVRGAGVHIADESGEEETDVEAGLDPESERLMERFNKEADAIRNVLSWARGAVGEASRALDSGRNLSEAGAKLDQVEGKLGAVRKRLKRIAGENKEFKRDHASRTGVMRTRVVQYKQMGEKFIKVAKDLEEARGAQAEALEEGVRKDVMAANPGMTVREADKAVQGGDRGLESAMAQSGGNTAELRYQLEDMKNRNAEIAGVQRNMQELNAMFVDMSILVEGQQELINNVEYNVEEVKVETKAAAEELVMARKHQKSRNKKKCWCMIICGFILAAAAIGVLLWVGNKLEWFSFLGGDDDEKKDSGDTASNSTSPDAAPSTQTGQAPTVQVTDQGTGQDAGQGAGQETAQGAGNAQRMIVLSDGLGPHDDDAIIQLNDGSAPERPLR